MRPWRDAAGWKATTGLSFSTSNDHALKHYDEAVDRLYAWRGNPISAAMEALREDPSFVMGNVFIGGMCLLGGSKAGSSPKLDAALEACQASLSTATAPERLHVQAIQHMAAGRLNSANACWSSILIDTPSDPVALRFQQDMFYFQGDAAQLRDGVARVMPQWRSDNPLRSYLHGMYAFGLEECNQYARAEQEAKTGLRLNQFDGWAAHAQAHVLEMEGRVVEGIAFLCNNENSWRVSTNLATHITWHLALYYIERGQHAMALRVYDENIAPRVSHGLIMDLVDAASLLFRLDMENINVGKRWGSVANQWLKHLDDHNSPFNDAHIAFGLLLADGIDHDTVTRWLDEMTRDAIVDPEDSAAPLWTDSSANQVGQALCRAAISFRKREYAAAVRVLYPLRHRVALVGGSRAQGDVFHLLLIQAALRSDEPHDTLIARTLLSERQSARPRSGMTARLIRQLNSIIGPRTVL